MKSEMKIISSLMESFAAVSGERLSVEGLN